MTYGHFVDILKFPLLTLKDKFEVARFFITNDFCLNGFHSLNNFRFTRKNILRKDVTITELKIKTKPTNPLSYKRYKDISRSRLRRDVLVKPKTFVYLYTGSEISSLCMKLIIIREKPYCLMRYKKPDILVLLLDPSLWLRLQYNLANWT